MADSGVYTPETIARRYAMAQQLLADPKRPVTHWAQGLDELAKGALGGYQINQTENLERHSRADANAQIAAALGLPAPAPIKDNPSGFEKIAALFNPKSEDAPIQSDAPSAPVFRANTQGAPAGMSPPIPSAAIPVADRIVNAESGGDPNAKNPRSSAAGAGQFIDSTWLDTIKKSNPQLASGKSDADLLALRSNPDISRSMTAAYAASNGDHLKSNGIDPTPGNTYLAHFAGPAGATAILKADPSTPIGSIVGQQAMIANPFLKNMTAGDLRSWADKRMGGGNPLANVPAVNGNGPSPLDTAQWPVGPINSPGQPVDGNQPSPLDNAQWPAGPVNAPGPIVNGDQPSALDTAKYPAGPIGAPSVAGGNALVDDATLPPNAKPVQATQSGPAPGILGGQSQQPAPAAPSIGPTGASPAGLAGNPNAAKIAALLTNPWIDSSVKTQVLTQLNPTYGFQTLPDGTILRTNPKTGTVEPIYKAPVKPVGVKAGEALVNPDTGQPLYQNEPKLPASALEYQYYQKNLPPGEKPMDYQTWATAKARAGATQLSNNIDMGGPQSYDKQLAEGLGKSHAAIANGVEDAQARARDVAAMQGAIDTIQKNGGSTGGLGQSQILELKKTINNGANAIGITTPFSEGDISDKEFLQKFNRQMAGAQAKGAVGSRVTNFEMSNYLKANPGLDLSVTGNQRLLGIQSQIEQRNIAVGNQIRNATAQAIAKGQRIDPVTVQKIITDYDEEHHISDPVNGQDLTQSYTLPEFQKSGTNPGLAGRHESNVAKIRRYNPDTGNIE